MNLAFWMAASVVAVFVCLVAAFPNLCISALNLVRSRGAREPYVYGPTPWLVVLSFTGGFASMFVAFVAFEQLRWTSNGATDSSSCSFAIGATASTVSTEAVYK